MAKRKNDLTSPAEDYIDQLNWQANHHRLRSGRLSNSVHYEPKWKYKIGYRYPPVTLLGRIMRALMLLGLVGLIVYLIFSSAMEVEGKIFYSIVSGLVFMIIFFAARDASKDSGDDPKHLD